MRRWPVKLSFALAGILSAAPAAAEEATRSAASIALNVPFLDVAVVSDFGEYLLRIYQFTGVVLISVAIITIMYAGILWLASADNPGRVKEAKKYITMAVAGIAFFLFSYSIMVIVNPDVLRLNVFTVKTVELESTDHEPAEEVEPTVLETDKLVRISGENIVITPVASDPRATPETIVKLRAAALQLKEKGFQMLITSSFRSPETQVATLYKNCPNAQVSCTEDFVCTVKGTCDVLTCKMSRGPTSCPHTTGRAIDAWAGKGGAAVINQKSCVADIGACKRIPGQAELIQAMRDAGFCNLCSEAWHFESPKMSSCCN